MLDGAARVKPLLEATAKANMSALAITDHGNMFGAYDFWRQARDHNINPIIGLEAYMVPGTHSRTHKHPVLFASGGPDDVSAKGAYTHMTLWAETTAGMHNLFKISSLSSLDGMYKKPRGDRALLEEYGAGIIGTTGCPSGEVQTLLRLGMYDKAVQTATDFADILGVGNFFVELMDHGLDIEKRVKDGLLRLAADTGLPVVATNDLHYVSVDDASAHDALLCVNSRSELSTANRFRFDSNHYYLRSADEMRLLFSNRPDACDNTLTIAERCHVEFDENINLMPVFDVPDGYNENSWFTAEVNTGLQHRFGDKVPADVQQRADYEIQVVTSMGFGGYFLVVADFINWAKRHNIRVGPGRGSGAGSMAAYALGITSLNPLKHGLLFERFLNPDRVSLPDFDVDFDDRRRGEVIDYVTRKYGADRVAQIVTMQIIKAKAAIKDSVRIHGLPYTLGDQATKLYPPPVAGKDLPLSAVINPTHERYVEGKDFRDFIQRNPDMSRVFDTALSIEGTRRGTGVHAAGVIMSRARLIDHIPIMRRPADDAIITQFENQWCEKLGLLKMDFLGLSNLTVIDDALSNIHTNRGETINLDDLPLTDTATYKMLATGHSVGVFQAESAGFQSLLRSINPTEFKHLDAALALYRPGPMGAKAHIAYANRKNGREPVTPIHPELATPLHPILSDTYGLIVYQEQVMEIAQVLAGYTLGQADLLRRAMGKKKKEILDQEFVPFRDGMLANGYSSAAVNTLWEILVPFSDYAFNKSHTAAYGLISYWTAWLKTHYPVEYMAALLTGARGERKTAAIFLSEARRMKIKVTVPDINESDVGYTAVGDTIRVGLFAIHGVGVTAADAIIAERVNGPYLSFADFVNRADMAASRLSIVEALIKSGTFDSTGHTRHALHTIYADALTSAAPLKKARAYGQNDLFATLTPEAATSNVPDLPEWPQRTLLGFEREHLGMYVSGHPLQAAAPALVTLSTTSIASLYTSTQAGHNVTIAGGLAVIEPKMSKAGAPWAVCHVEDFDTRIDVLCFPRTYEIVAEHLTADAVVVVSGRVDRDDDGTPKIVAETLQPVHVNDDGNLPIYLTCGVSDINAATVEHIKQLTTHHQGTRPLHLIVNQPDGTSRTYQLPGIMLTVNDRSASELKALFGSHCLTQPA